MLGRGHLSGLTAGVLAALLLNGCATVRTLNEYRPGDPVFLSGARLDVAAIRKDRIYLSRLNVEPPPWPWVDLPFSFTADLFFWMLPRTPPSGEP